MKPVEEMTVNQLKEFADKIERPIPKGMSKKAEMIEFLKNPKKSTDPAAEALAEHKAKVETEREAQAKTVEDRRKRACKQPLNEKEKAYLAELEVLARSGHQPNTDQMLDLGVLRERSKITSLSVVEQNELAELEVKRQNPDIKPIPSSGVTEEERYEQLGQRSKIDET